MSEEIQNPQSITPEPVTPPPTPDIPPVTEAVVSGPVELGAEVAVQPTFPPPPSQGTFWGTGRRKSSVARVRMTSGTGKISINKRPLEQYFSEVKDRGAVTAALELTETAGRWDVAINVAGGGPTGQSGAIKLGVARALVKASNAYEPKLRDAGLLTRDARQVERKKYGHRKARRSYQFSKR